MRYDSLCSDYQKTPSALATTYKRLYAGTHKEHISRQQFANDINFVYKNLKSNNQYFFPQTMISRFNLLPHRHFHYLSLIESLFDSFFKNMLSVNWMDQQP
jgi:hypothetical protein